MHEELIAAVVEEIAPELRGRAFGKVWLLGRDRLAADFRLSEGRFLFFSLDPSAPRLHLVERRVRDLERQSLAPSNFALTLRKQLGGALLRAVTKDAGERVVRFSFEAHDAAGSAHARTLVAQLTGRTANLFLLDEDSRVTDALRPARGAGQEAGAGYRPPERGPHARAAAAAPPLVGRGPRASLSAALDEHFGRLEAAREFDARVSTHRARLRREIERRRKLERNLAADMDAHGDADAHKRAGDLLLANIATAERDGARVRLTDYFAEGAPALEMEIDEHSTLQDEAARRFALYTRAKRAAQEVARRRKELRAELVPLEARLAELERLAAARDEAALAAFDERAAGDKKSPGRAGRAERAGRRAGPKSVHAAGGRAEKASGGRAAAGVPGARRYLSTDGYEILVGRGARDNDQLTFKVARSHDLWLHAADYPGSHVIVRNSARGADIPQRTVHEAAQLAAHFSQAKRDSKVAVNYALRKFVSKPKGAAHGLVRISSFRTLLVEPREGAERVG
ncbi:MAG: NFACT RNA binding domain-containing protein [Acidobacteria bacterium]|nr:NFACT RNA binding domain-containing protein [Acidobacteriota bacterium]